jgi:hypothetical protein
MNVDQMNKLAQGVQSVSQCGFCGRPWFGLVAYCPYCGREPSFAKINQEPDDRPQSDERDESESESDEPRKKPRGPLLVKTAIAGLSALLLLWIVVKAPAPKTDEGASPHAIATSRMGAGPSTSAAQVPSAQVPSVKAPPVQAPSVPPRTDTTVAPPSNNSLCSVASETAGLCKSQQ